MWALPVQPEIVGKTNEKLPHLKAGEQTILLKKAIILYFEDAKIKF